MKLSERIARTANRQACLGRADVSRWYWNQRQQILCSGDDPEHPPLRDVLKRFNEKRPFVAPPIPEPLPAVHSPYD